ncbi:MAG: Dolichyl-phosphate mannose synthase related protein [Candidatus Azambacteria bacterium GW2011_GWB1_42_17]|uniref:Dolichyl-phosphate mannose synthase related protein n=1 Tax=Candidatus Azambacteria bacterium GW2011_GWB1_42_17 TaxID=1618615 RepID=A0A0G0Z829_9BACT|nr:MAG: Dolichyl-phosphate mannose synthase related protein [Candidatus Azambacteria bacterium GW2011_GWB1_42_17]
MNWPKISVVIPTFNEEKNIKKCLDSIFTQDYPRNKLEVLVVDDDSTDQTVKIAEKYPIRLLRNGQKHGEIGKMIGFKASTGKYFIYLDADVELISKDFFKKLVTPLEQNNKIIASFTKEGAGPNSAPMEKYLSFDSLQRDGLYQWLTPSVESTIIKHFPNYSLCKYAVNKIPPSGRCLYRRQELAKATVGFDMFLELDFLKLMVKLGHKLFAYVPNAVMYHHHVKSISELLRKRKYNLTRVYFRHISNRLYTWVNWKNPIDWAKLLVWIIYANLFIPSLITGIYKSVRYKSFVGLYEPLINLLVTDMLLFAFIKKMVISTFRNH